MERVTTIGLDIAKSVFQVHGVSADGEVLIRRRLTRGRMLPFFAKLPRCLVGIEAYNNSHYWARELTALGHDVKLMPAQYVKSYVKRGKNDAADAEAICEAVTRPTMRFVAVKSPEQQSLMMLHRVGVQRPSGEDSASKNLVSVASVAGGHEHHDGRVQVAEYHVWRAAIGGPDWALSGPAYQMARSGCISVRARPRRTSVRWVTGDTG